MRAVLADPRKTHDAYYLLQTCVEGLDRQDGSAARAAAESPPNAQPGAGPFPVSTLDASAQAASFNHFHMNEAFRLVSVVLSFSTDRVRLEAFVGFLRANAILPEVQEYSFGQQDILQKCAFIAQEGFGLGLGYSYHLHEYGTFSSLLAADYCRLVEEGTRSSEIFMQPQFDGEGFASLVSGKDEKWLSLAATMVHEMGSCEEGSLLAHVGEICAYYERGLAKRVLKGLKSALPRAPGAPARGTRA